MKKHFVGGYTDLLAADQQCKSDLQAEKKMAEHPVCRYLYGGQYSEDYGIGESSASGNQGNVPALAGA